MEIPTHFGTIFHILPMVATLQFSSASIFQTIVINLLMNMAVEIRYGSHNGGVASDSYFLFLDCNTRN